MSNEPETAVDAPDNAPAFDHAQYRVDELRRSALSLAIDYVARTPRPERQDVLATAREFHAFLAGGGAE